MNKADFDRIIAEKKRTKERLERLRTDLSVFLYAALIHDYPYPTLRDGLSQIVGEAEVPHKKLINARMQAIARKSYKSSKTPTTDRKTAVFDIVDKEKSYDAFDKACSDILRKQEEESKKKVLDMALKSPAKGGSEKQFCLCSRHDDCAKDHKDWQGKIYVKEWALKDPEIRKWCDERGIKTVEWVTGRPVWMTTRPNCRHFFKDVSFDEVRGERLGVLLKENGMDRVAGTKGTQQNINHLTRKEWYTQTNVKNIIRKYEERLQKHERMREVATNVNLENAILHDKFLIRKWKEYLAKMTT